MKRISSTITIQNKKYNYSVTEKTKKIAEFECVAAKIKQDFLKEDIADLLIDLPNLIIAEKEREKTQKDVIRFRISSEDKAIVEKKALKAGFINVSDYLRHLALAS